MNTSVYLGNCQIRSTDCDRSPASCVDSEWRRYIRNPFLNSLLITLWGVENARHTLQHEGCCLSAHHGSSWIPGLPWLPCHSPIAVRLSECIWQRCYQWRNHSDGVLALQTFLKPWTSALVAESQPSVLAMEIPSHQLDLSFPSRPVPFLRLRILSPTPAEEM